MKKGTLIVISGFSGSGKGTIISKLIEKYDNYSLSISATTRKPRYGETDGREYFFISRDDFEKKIKNGDFIEYALYVDNYYGTPGEYVVKQLNSGKNVILEIEIQGAAKIKERFEDALMVFIAPSSAEILEQRLKNRSTEDGEEITKRLRRAADESFFIKDYDYIIINDTLEKAVESLNNLVECENMAVNRNLDFIDELERGLNKF